MTRVSAIVTCLITGILSILVIGQASMHAVLGQGFMAVTFALLTVALAIVEQDR